MDQRLSDRYSGRERRSVIDYYLDGRDPLTAKLDRDIQKLNEGMPVQYVCGCAFFYGYRFRLGPGVLIPRPETEEIVYWVETDMGKKSGLTIVDIGTGSGCIIVSLLNRLEGARGIAVDISPIALKTALHNASSYNHELSCMAWDVMNSPLPGELGKASVVVCNPPYILHSERERMDDSVLTHEPEEALFVEGSDPLVFYKRVLSLFAFPLPEKRPVLYFETSDLYKTELETFLSGTDWTYTFRQDLQGKWRMLKCE